MNTRIKTAIGSVALVSASLLGGGLFAASSVNAQVDDVPVETTVDVPVDADTPVETDAPVDADTPAEDGQRERHGRHGNRGGGCSSEATAELLGIDVADLSAALEAGDTLAEIAEANGVDPQVIIDAEIAEKTERIQAKVEAGDITQDQADEKLADVEEQVTTRVNEGGSERGGRQAADVAADTSTDEG